MNVDAHRAKINLLLLQVSELVRTEARRKLKKHRELSAVVLTLSAQILKMQISGRQPEGSLFDCR